MTNVLLCCCKSGQEKVGTELGPIHIVSELQKTREFNISYTITDEEFISQSGYQSTYDYSIKCNDRLLTLGGDHSIGLSTIMASLYKFGKKLRIIWVDALPDINTYDSSVSKNIHGMPVSPAFGLMKPWIKLKDEILLEPSQLIYIGLRSVDEPEKEFIKNIGIKSYYAKDVQEMSIKKVMEEIMLTDTEETVYHLSFDLDGLDTAYTPSVGTPVKERGLSIGDGMYIVETLNKTERLKSFDLVEYNTLVGSKEDNKKTLNACIRLIEKYLKN